MFECFWNSNKFYVTKSSFLIQSFFAWFSSHSSISILMLLKKICSIKILFFWLFVYLQAASNIQMCVAFSAFNCFFFRVHSECEIFPPLQNTMHKICHHWFNIAINGYCVCLTTFLLNTIFSFILFWICLFVCQLPTTMVKRSSYECLWWIINHFP